MIQFTEKRIPKVVVGLTLFWLCIVEAFFWTGEFNLRFLPMWLASIVAGFCMAKWTNDEFRDAMLTRLCYDRTSNLPIDHPKAFLHKSRGVQSNLGQIPFKRSPLACTADLDLEILINNLPKELSRAQFTRLFACVFQNDESASALAILTTRVVRTLCHKQFIDHPAGIDRHGGRSLLTHTILVTALLLHRASSYKYQPTRHTPINPEFKLKPNDPLLPVIGVIHDIGKLTKLVIDDRTGRPQILSDHTGESARIVADFEEFWVADISSDDRLLIQDAISYSHSINSLPVKKSTLAKPHVTSDRLYALVDFLYECDVLASSIEMGASYDFDSGPVETEIKPEPESIESIDLYDEFLTFLAVRADINATDGAKSVGFRYKGPVDGKELNIVVFDEKKFAQDFSKFLDKPELKEKEDRRSVITGLVLTALDENELLIRDHKEVGHRPAKDCLYKVTFRDPNSEDSGSSIVLPSAFVISLEGVERLKTLAKMENCHSIPSFGNSIFGAKRIGSAKSSILENVAMEALGLKPTGQEKSSVSVTSIAKSAVKSPAVVLSKIRHGLIKGVIVPTKLANDSSNDIYIVGFNSFFENLGIQLSEDQSNDNSLSEFGIKSIKRSKRNPDDFVVCLLGDQFSGSLS